VWLKTYPRVVVAQDREEGVSQEIVVLPQQLVTCDTREQGSRSTQSMGRAITIDDSECFEVRQLLLAVEVMGHRSPGRLPSSAECSPPSSKLFARSMEREPLGVDTPSGAFNMVLW
jgi:hypothetical protein